MTSDEIRMTKQIPGKSVSGQNTSSLFGHSGLIIRVWSFGVWSLIRHSIFVIRHFVPDGVYFTRWFIKDVSR
jgi:hypothetical protein